jgi:Restriction endonuclease
MEHLVSYEEARLEPGGEEVTLYDGSIREYIPGDCTFCLSPLHLRSEHDLTFVIPELDVPVLSVCNSCGWWKAITDTTGLFGVKPATSLHGIAKRYSIDALDAPLSALRSYLTRHPHSLAHVNPRTFERLMADCLRDKFHPCEVIHVGGRGDGGVDIHLILSDTSRFLVQVKRREDINSIEGPEVVRELNGVLFREGEAKGIVITTASRFSAAAHLETKVRTPTSQTYDLKLFALDEIIDLLNLRPKDPYEPWKRFLEANGETSS